MEVFHDGHACRMTRKQVIAEFRYRVGETKDDGIGEAVLTILDEYRDVMGLLRALLNDDEDDDT